MHGGCALTPLPPKSVHPNTRTDIFDLNFRLILLLFIGIMAVWANHEVSKGLAGKRFSLFYESNDKATRVVLNSSKFVENLLFPNQDFQHYTRKRINGVTLRLARTTLSSIVSVDSPKPYEYFINLSPWLMETSNYNEAIVMAIFQGMARVWLWEDKRRTLPPMLLNGMVEYISNLAGFTPAGVFDSTIMSSENIKICWKDEDPRKVAGFLKYVDSGGFGDVIRRLNEGMRKGWHDRLVDDALGMEGQHACASYDMLMRTHRLSSSM